MRSRDAQPSSDVAHLKVEVKMIYSLSRTSFHILGLLTLGTFNV